MAISVVIRNFPRLRVFNAPDEGVSLING